VEYSSCVGELSAKMVKELYLSAQSQQNLGGQVGRIVQTKLEEEHAPLAPEQIREFVEYPVAVENGVNAVLYGGL
jgi:hypothetical protein